jgi:SAM-dependent methyltransferase
MPYNLSIPGWMPEAELKTLEDLARTIPKNGKMVEVGPFLGRSSWCWAKTVDPSVKVFCLDIWNPDEHPYYPPAVIKGQEDNLETSPEFGYAEKVEHLQGNYENFKRNTADCPNIQAISGASPFDFLEWRDQVDLVFLDGIHHHPIFWADLNFWYYKIKPGGIFCGDDSARTHPDVVWGVQDFAKNLGLPYIVQGRIWMIPVPPFKNITQALFSKGSN